MSDKQVLFLWILQMFSPFARVIFLHLEVELADWQALTDR